jgi:hypothetical protein
MIWDKYKAQRWLLKVGMDHLHAGMFAEGGELIYESKTGDAFESREQFIDSIKRICCWDDDMIQESIQEFLSE